MNSARLYISGKATDNIGFMFNTEYNSDDEEIRVIDAAAQFSFSGGKHNIWVGRFLPPSDRANLYGPYYASNWGVYQDGVQDGYPFETEGRDDGIMYWGQYDKVKFSIGAFDVTGLTTGDSDVLLAVARAGRFLGCGRRLLPERHLLRREGPAGHRRRGANRGCRRGLLVRLPAREEARQFGRRDGRVGVLGVRRARRLPTPVGGGYEKSDGFYVLGAYLFPGEAGPGKFQVLAKYGQATYDFFGDDLDQDTIEFDVNYLIKTFNARISLYYLDKSFDPDVGGDTPTIGLGLQIQM